MKTWGVLRPTLLNISTEIQLKIFSFLDDASRQCLKASHRRFHQSFPQRVQLSKCAKRRLSSHFEDGKKGTHSPETCKILCALCKEMHCYDQFDWSGRSQDEIVARPIIVGRRRKRPFRLFQWPFHQFENITWHTTSDLRRGDAVKQYCWRDWYEICRYNPFSPGPDSANWSHDYLRDRWTVIKQRRCVHCSNPIPKAQKECDCGCDVCPPSPEQRWFVRLGPTLLGGSPKDVKLVWRGPEEDDIDIEDHYSKSAFSLSFDHGSLYQNSRADHTSSSD